jgi:hypothetical protein
MAQFGSVFRMKPKPGKKAELLKLFTTDDGRKIDGFIVAHAIDAGDEVWGVAVFRDEASYRKNADDPKQHEEFLKMMELIESEPEWHDGTIESMQA